MNRPQLLPRLLKSHVWVFEKPTSAQFTWFQNSYRTDVISSPATYYSISNLLPVEKKIMNLLRQLSDYCQHAVSAEHFLGIWAYSLSWEAEKNWGIELSSCSLKRQYRLGSMTLDTLIYDNLYSMWHWSVLGPLNKVQPIKYYEYKTFQTSEHSTENNK
jgi:hypothetical protein